MELRPLLPDRRPAAARRTLSAAAPPAAAPPPAASRVGVDAGWIERHLASCLDPVPPLRAPRCGRHAAVLVPILLGPGDPLVLLTARALTLRHHPGQVSFPGGRIDPDDPDPRAAALREAEEEIGLDPSTVRVVGALPSVETMTGFTIDPVVGLVRSGAPVFPSPAEVEAILYLPVASLLDPALPRIEAASGVVGGPVSVWPHDTHRIWGATARILRTLAERLRRAA